MEIDPPVFADQRDPDPAPEPDIAPVEDLMIEEISIDGMCGVY